MRSISPILIAVASILLAGCGEVAYRYYRVDMPVLIRDSPNSSVRIEVTVSPDVTQEKKYDTNPNLSPQIPIIPGVLPARL